MMLEGLLVVVCIWSDHTVNVEACISYVSNEHLYLQLGNLEVLVTVALSRGVIYLILFLRDRVSGSPRWF